MAQFSRDQRIGIEAEDWLFNQLAARGYKPRIMRWSSENCDLKVGNLPIEVKVAYPTMRKTHGKLYTRWQWFIHPTAHRMNGDWALALIAHDKSGKRYVYIMPGSAIDQRTHIQLTSHPDRYNGWVNQWRDRWSVIDYLQKRFYTNNGPLFAQWEAAA